MPTSIYTRTQNFLSKAKIIHNNKYEYSLVNYINTRTKVKIICPIHGIFEQRPSDHINGCGCKKCQYKVKASNSNNFIQSSKSIHKGKYDYSLVKYINNYTHVKIICPIHGIFEQIPNSHLNANGCKSCSNDNQLGKYNTPILYRNPELANTQSMLYLIKHENLHKIGITIQNITKRFNKSIKIISQLDNITLFESFNKEQEILSKYHNYQERPNNWNYGGKTEFLNITQEQRNQIILDYFMV